MKIRIDRDLKISLLKSLQVGIVDLSIFDTKEYKIKALNNNDVERLKQEHNSITVEIIDKTNQVDNENTDK